MDKIQKGITQALKGLEILQKRADEKNDIAGMIVILGVAVALQQVCEGVNELQQEQINFIKAKILSVN